MKKTLLFLLTGLTYLTSVAQTNTFPTTGNVGIGTTTPLFNLDITNETGPYIFLRATDYTISPTVITKKGGIIFNQEATNKTAAILSAIPPGYHVPGILFSTKLAWNNPGSGTTDWYDRMFIHPNGNVGIGTTDPLTKLDVRSGIDHLVTSTSFVAPLNIGITSDVGAGSVPNYILLSPMITGGTGSPQAGLSGILSLYRGSVTTGNINAEYRIITQTAWGNSYISLVPLTDNTVSLNVYKVTYNNQLYFAIKATEITGSGGRVTFRGEWWNAINGTKPQIVQETQVSDVSIYKSVQSVHGNLIYATKDGNVSIGTSDPKGYKLAVAGKIRATEIKVEATPWPDYVFAKDYKLPSLKETEQHINEKGHLPGIPSAEEVKANGIDLGEMNAKLLQKIEELTLHLIELQKTVEMQSIEIKQLKAVK